VDRKHRALKNAPIVGGIVLVILVILGGVWLIRTFMAQKDQKPPRMVQNITVIRPPPPPPEQPPPPPPPEKIQEQVPQDKPEPTPDNNPPPAEQSLGLDAEGDAGGDAFGLAARPGGSDLVGGTGNAVFAWYTNKIRDVIVERLSSDPKLHGKKYSLQVLVWLEPDGRIKQVQLATGSGDQEVDRLVAADFVGLRVSDAPPLEMPQPVRYQLNSHT